MRRWRAKSKMAADYTVFTHILSADGTLFTQHDAPPRIPTSAWRPGQIILDVHELTVPVDQPFTLTVGMYRPDTGARLPVSNTTSPEPNAVEITSRHP